MPIFIFIRIIYTFIMRFVLIIIGAIILAVLFIYILSKLKKYIPQFYLETFNKELDLSTLEGRYLGEKFYLLLASLSLDAIGMFSYLIPIVGEVSDIIISPIMAIFLFFLYRNYNRTTRTAIFNIFRTTKKTKFHRNPFISHIFGPIGYFIEEALTPLDIIPSATILWFYTFHMDATSKQEAFCRKESFYAFKEQTKAPPNIPPSRSRTFLPENKHPVAATTLTPITTQKQQTITQKSTSKPCRSQEYAEQLRIQKLVTAAKTGDISSILELSNIYLTKKDDTSMEIAFKLLHYAASKNSFIAHAKLGILYCYKSSKFYNYNLGIKHLKIAAANNIPQAKSALKKLRAK